MKRVVDTVVNIRAVSYTHLDVYKRQTMQKAMAELERQGLLYSHRTSGRFITEDTKMIEEMKANLAKEQVKLFFQNMQKIGYSKTETLQIVIKAAEEMK